MRIMFWVFAIAWMVLALIEQAVGDVEVSLQKFMIGAIFLVGSEIL